jgi:hypothetical protein
MFVFMALQATVVVSLMATRSLLLPPSARHEKILPAGPAGKVNAQQFSGAVNTRLQGTPTNCNTVATLSLTVSDPPTQSELRAVANKHDELINALRR